MLESVGEQVDDVFVSSEVGEVFEREVDGFKRDAANAISEKNAIEEKLSILLTERDSIQLKVEAMLEAMMAIDADVAAAVGR